jgi:hypothetical protein
LAIVKDVSDARVYGGAHFRRDQDAAEQLGKAVAQWNLDNHLRPRMAAHSAADPGTGR